MLYSSLVVLKNRLNQFLKQRSATVEEMAVLASIGDVSNGVAQDGNAVVLSLANIEKETAAYATRQLPDPAMHGVLANKPLHLNVYLLLSACFGPSSYEESLKQLSACLEFFQAHHIFDHHSTPELDNRIDKLVIELVNMSMHELSNLWGMAGGKYYPSAMYKMRMVIIDAHEMRAELPSAKGYDVGMQKK